MRVVSVAEVKARLSEHLRACRSGPVVITRNGRASAMLIPVLADDDLESLILAHSPVFQAIIHRSRERVDRQGAGGVPHARFWKGTGKQRRRRAVRRRLRPD